ncbi:hypothetical protein [Mycolicibacter arupensis]|nr:hypothetical protein [Mycolicibacter arupensis]MCV7277294.1 hypothetical protein [Mycolicibacter arupensis]
MAIKAWLIGDAVNLETLAHLLPEGDTRVVHDAERDAYYLTSPEIDNPPEGQAYYHVAKELLVRLNGFARVADSGYTPVNLKGAFSEGNSEHQVIFAESARVISPRVGMVAVNVRQADGMIIPGSPSPWPVRFAAVGDHPDAIEALQIMSQPDQLGWPELYKIHEIIRDSIKPGKIYDLGWADKVTDSAFTGSANLPSVSGSGARHARMSGNPKNTMSIVEGRDYISALVAKWLDWLRQISSR